MNKIFSIYSEACLGNVDALVFLTAFHCFTHAIDDVVDGDTPYNPERFIGILMQANTLYSTPFFIANSARLSGVIANIANTYADSVEWEKSDVKWHRDVANVIRRCGNDMVTTIAFIVGGFSHMRSISTKLRDYVYEPENEEVLNG